MEIASRKLTIFAELGGGPSPPPWNRFRHLQCVPFFKGGNPRVNQRLGITTELPLKVRPGCGFPGAHDRRFMFA